MRQTCSTVGGSWLRCSQSCAHNLCTLPACKLRSAASVLTHLSLRPQLPSFLSVLAAASPKQLKLHYVHRFPSLRWWLSMIPFSFFGGRKWARGDRWRRESNTARTLKCTLAQYVHTHILHTPSVEFYDSIICFLRHTYDTSTHQ